MHKFVLFLKELSIPTKKEALDAIASLPNKKYYLFVFLFLIMFFSFIVLLNSLNNKFLVDVPIRGGSITEGIIGMPTLVNPVLATSNADKDLVALVYSGLMRKLPSGNIITDLAESYNVSKDFLVYTFILKDNLKFHDGEKIRAKDIVYTINKIKDPNIKSPIRNEWDNVSVEEINENTIVFKLKQPYISFLDNATVGILPSHIWDNYKNGDFNLAPHNIKAIGSGPYKIDTVEKNNDGIPDKYILKSFSSFSLGKPNINEITILSFSNEKTLLAAFSDKRIDIAGGVTASNINTIKSNNYVINSVSLPRIFGLFYNTNNNKIFTDENVLKAIELGISKKEIIESVFLGHASAISHPIPPNIYNKDALQKDVNIIEANAILDKAGWQKGEDGIRTKGGVTYVEKTKKVGKKIIKERVKVNNGPVIKLEFSITTGDSTEFKNTVSIIKNQLEKLGISVNIDKVYELGSLNQIIQERDYEALFFGQIVKRESDLFSYWHSSQRKDPGLNIALYNNIKADKILEDLQKITDLSKKYEKYDEFINIFNKELPAILIYTPKYTYITNNKINNLNIDSITNLSDRFSTVYDWYANKDRVWKIFTK